MALQPGSEMMDERYSAPRHRVSEDGLVVVGEHTTLPCMLYDRSDTGVRLTMPDARSVPATFVLIAPCLGVAHVCSVAWRTDETIGVRLDRATA
ncbi:PilZ domain-containing protein [Methylobacterium nigriterrae]|uniref:PilZ domain-containing protein n=1 Tax=Methylobacterium nigriterrae TaxID=3127512 RepID=UPI0030137D64